MKNGTTWNRLQLGSDGKAVIYKSTDSGATWPSAERVVLNSDFSMVKKAQLSPSDDFNNVKETGYYKFTGWPVNCPGTNGFGVLVVYVYENYITQVAYTDNKIYTRSSFDASDTWGTWA